MKKRNLSELTHLVLLSDAKLRIESPPSKHFRQKPSNLLRHDCLLAPNRQHVCKSCRRTQRYRVFYFSHRFPGQGQTSAHSGTGTLCSPKSSPMKHREPVIVCASAPMYQRIFPRRVGPSGPCDTDGTVTPCLIGDDLVGTWQQSPSVTRCSTEGSLKNGQKRTNRARHLRICQENIKKHAEKHAKHAEKHAEN